MTERSGHLGPIPDKKAQQVAAVAEETKRHRTNAEAKLNNSNANKSFSGKNTGDNVTRVSAAKANKINASTTSNTKRGNSVKYLTARIASARPDIHERMKAGEYKSVRRAAIDAGIVRELTRLEKAKRAVKKMTKKELAAFRKWLRKPAVKVPGK